MQSSGSTAAAQPSLLDLPKQFTHKMIRMLEWFASRAVNHPTVIMQSSGSATQLLHQLYSLYRQS
jgi:hypothetical protein